MFQLLLVKTYSIENVATNDTVFSSNRKSNCEIVISTSIFACITGKIKGAVALWQIFSSKILHIFTNSMAVSSLTSGIKI